MHENTWNCLTTVIFSVRIGFGPTRGLCLFFFKHSSKWIFSVSYRFVWKVVPFPIKYFWLSFQSFCSPKALLDTNDIEIGVLFSCACKGENVLKRVQNMFVA